MKSDADLDQIAQAIRDSCQLPSDLKSSLIYFHPDVAIRRAKKNTSESTSYERLMRNAMGVLELKAKQIST